LRRPDWAGAADLRAASPPSRKAFSNAGYSRGVWIGGPLEESLLELLAYDAGLHPQQARAYLRAEIARRRSAAGTGPLELELAQLDPADLPCECLRQVVHELDAARIRVGGEPFAHEALDLVGELVAALVALGEHDERFHDIAAQLVGRRDG